MSDKVRNEPPGKVLEIKVAHLADLPVNTRSSGGRWAKIYDHFDALPIIDSNAKNGPDDCLTVTLENASDANRMNSSLHGYARVRKCHERGWKVRQRTLPSDESGNVRAILWKQRVSA